MGSGSGFFRLRDWSNENSTFSYLTGVVTAGNLGGVGGVLDLVGDLKAAVEGITLGEIVGEGLTVYNNRIAPTATLTKETQREKKWLVTYADNTAFFDAPTNSIPNEGYGKIFNAEIPTADLSLLPTAPPGDFADITAGAMATFVTAFEALCKTPYGGVPNVLSIQYVGRDL